MIDRLLARAIEQRGQLAVGAVTMDLERAVAFLNAVLGDVVDVELNVNLRV